MNQIHDEYLWNPAATPDAEIEHLERLLRPLGATALSLSDRAAPLPRPTWRRMLGRRFVALAAAAAAVLASAYSLHVYRLNWSEGSPWPVTVREQGRTQAALLSVDERLTTTSRQSATLSAARIGKVDVAPNSTIRLVRTEKGRHRIELERGKLHAKIWAPPNYFSVAHGDARFIDMGCEFDLSIESAGKGVLSVGSGWVFYEHNYDEILVPEGYSLAFDEGSAKMALRTDVAPDFREAVTELETQLERVPAVEQSTIAELTQRIADSARDQDYYTLFTLLRHHPQLARSALYPRLALALKADPNDEDHRTRWINGDPSAKNEWWQRWPKPPKQWWLNWRDLF